MDERPTKWQIFRGWHKQESLWREIYARTVAGISTALVIFLAAVAGGYVKLHRAGAITAVGLMGTFGLVLVMNLIGAIGSGAIFNHDGEPTLMQQRLQKATLLLVWMFSQVLMFVIVRHL